MSETWDRSAPGILPLPSDGDRLPCPGSRAGLSGRTSGCLPDEADVLSALAEAWQRAVAERVEIACAGGHGRTGTALSCLAILDGVPGTEAVAFVREHYGQPLPSG